MLALTTQRAYITSIIVALSAYDDDENHDLDLLEYYRDLLMKKNEEYNKFINTNEKTEKQKTNWATMDELKKVQNDYRLEIVRRGLNVKEKINNSELQLIQKYLVSSLYTLQPPVRLDFANMEIINNIDDDDNKKNYLYVKSRNTKFFIFNDFKTKSSKGSITQKINPELNKIINFWLRFNKSKNFLLNKMNKPMTENALGKYITRIFKIPNKKITLNLIRHIYISQNIDIDKIKEEERKKEQLAESMHHSTSMQKAYAKSQQKN